MILLRLLFYFFYCSSISFAVDTPLPKNQSQPVFVIQAPPCTLPPMNFYLHNQNSPSNGVYTTSTSTAASSTQITQTTIVSSLQTMKKCTQKISKNLRQWIFDHSGRLALTTMFALYSYIWYRLLVLSYALSNQQAWHSYKPTLSFDELLRIRQDDFAQDLIKTIQHRYAPQTLGDFFVPFALFLKDIDTEVVLLENLINIYKRLSIFRMHWLFPWQRFSSHEIEEKLRRVLYIKNVAFTWLSTFKFEKYTHHFEKVS